MRALVVTNMYPTPERPQFGRFVRDQVEALAQLPGLDVAVHAFPGGGPAAYLRAAAELRRLYRRARFDVVHAHFGLSAWPARAVPARVRAVTLHGTDLEHPRSRPITLAGLRSMDLVAAVSAELAGRVPRWAINDPARVLPCGVDLERFHRIDRREARAELGLAADAPHLLFPADPARPEKRGDLAAGLAGQLGVKLLTLGAVDPERVPLYVNAANAVVVPSDREGFGLAVLEALACDVPVLATPHGVAPEALAGIEGCLCAPFSPEAWSETLRPHVGAADPRVPGRPRAEGYSAQAMARRVAEAWEEVLATR
jgi:glycosyltransferase involved in cell wall biosynthesis